MSCPCRLYSTREFPQRGHELAAWRPSPLFALRVLTRAHEMKRNVGLVAHHPAIVPGCDIEEISRFHFDDPAIVHGRGGASRNHYPYVLYRATGGAKRSAHMFGPLPTRLIGRTPDGRASNIYQLELSFFKCPEFIRLFKTFENDFVQGLPPMPEFGRVTSFFCDDAL